MDKLLIVDGSNLLFQMFLGCRRELLMVREKQYKGRLDL